jgi:hypothetical protein
MAKSDLIEALSADLRPVSSRAFDRELLLCLVLSGAAVLLVLDAGRGDFFDAGVAARGWPLWTKWLYTAPLCLFGGLATAATARPGSRFPPMAYLCLLSIVPLADLAGLELARAPTDQWASLWLGQSWRRCSAGILVLSAPIFAALTWKVRQGAPTHLIRAGGAIGLAAGAGAATLYALVCGETSACFVMAWYTLAMTAAAALGALLGPMILRW